jgi:hypothetical protein
MGRGIEGTKIFRNKGDRTDFLQRLVAGPARYPRLVRANSPTRKLFCQLAVGKMGYPGAEVARFLGVTTCAVVRAAKTEELKEVQKYL